MPHARARRRRDEFVDRFSRRLDPRAPSSPALSCSVVVCTHRRPHYIDGLLDALSELHPQPDEVVVVDNDPDDQDCHAQVQRAGARYVREDRRGLDNARTAGVLAARGDFIAFTDDDCLPSTGWLRSLPELFDDPTVAAVTGPAFAAVLDTPAQLAFEEAGGFTRGLARRSFDWTVMSPAAASAAGAGANMVFRRAAIEELGSLFPPELDAGTPTQSGGDMYALYKVLAAGYRVVYDPATYVLHRHRADQASLRKTIWGYGVGLSAALTKILVEEADVATPAAWRWLWRQYVEAIGHRLAGSADVAQGEIAWDYLRGGVAGPWALWCARRQISSPPGTPQSRGEAAARVQPESSPGQRPGAKVEREAWQAPSEAEEVGLSVIVPTRGRPAALRHCLHALALQEPPGVGVEVIVVDDAQADAKGPPTRAEARGARVRYLESGGIGAAGARNAGASAARGSLLLFLDDDLVPEPDLLVRHIDRHRTAASDSSGVAERIVIGHSPPRPRRRTLAALGACLWWEDHFRLKRDAAAMTFVEVLSGNMSVAREVFERIGPFDGTFGRLRREDWEWGIRALQAGVEVEYDHAAVAAHEFFLDTRGAIDAARREGRGDALLLDRFPFAAPSLPRRGGRGEAVARPGRELAFWALFRPRPQAAAAIALDVLEQAKARRAWWRGFKFAHGAAYEKGRREGDRSLGGDIAEPPVLAVELGSDEPIPRPQVAAPELELRLDGRRLRRVKPSGGRWHRSLAHQVAAALGPEAWRGLAPGRSRDADASLREGALTDTAVVFGPGRRPDDERHRTALEAAGATVEVVAGGEADHWSGVDRAVRESRAEVVGVPLPGLSPRAAWLRGARPGLDGDRVAAVVGCACEDGETAGPLVLHSRSTERASYPLLGWPAQYIVVRRRLYEALGGFDTATAPFGQQGPLLDFIERALEAAYVVGYREVPGFDAGSGSRPARRRSELSRHRAYGGLMFRRSIEIGGGRGAWWLASRGVGPLLIGLKRGARASATGRRDVAWLVAAFASGCLEAWRATRTG